MLKGWPGGLIKFLADTQYCPIPRARNAKKYVSREGDSGHKPDRVPRHNFSERVSGKSKASSGHWKCHSAVPCQIWSLVCSGEGQPVGLWDLYEDSDTINDLLLVMPAHG